MKQQSERPLSDTPSEDQNYPPDTESGSCRSVAGDLSIAVWARYGAIGVIAGAVLGGRLLLRPNPFAPIRGFEIQPIYFLWALLILAAGALVQWRMFSGAGELAPLRLPSSAAQRLILGGIVFIAAILRLPFLDFGLPRFYHPDEGPKAEIVVRMLTEGSFHPHYFLHPSLLLYLTREVSAFYGWIGVELEPVARSVLAGRTVSGLAGITAVLLTCAIGRRLFSAEAGLLAGFFLAVSPLHVTCSRYLKEDALCVTLVLASLYFVIRSLQEQRSRDLMFAALLAGCASGAKYSGMLAAVPLLATPWLCTLRLAPDRAQLKRVCWVLPLVPLGFLICCPYALLDSKQFLANFMVERNHMKNGHNGVSIDAWSQWWTYHFSRSLMAGMTPGPLLVGLFGVGALLWERSWRALLIVGMIGLFYLPAEWVHAKPPPQPERYVLPCVPFFALAAGIFLSRCSRMLSPAVMVAVVIGVCVLPAWRSIALARDLKLDTREQMRSWIAENLPPGTRILIEASYSPQLTETLMDRTLTKLERHPERFTRRALLNSGNEYLLVNSLMYDRYFKEPKVNELLKKRIVRIFETFPVVAEFNAPAGSYGFHNPQIRLYRISAHQPPG